MTRQDFLINWKIFLINFLAMFIMVTLHNLGVRLPYIGPLSILSPLPYTSDVFKTIVPKLEEKQNTYHLKHTTSFIPKSYATGDFENAGSYVVLDFDSGQVLAEKSLRQSRSIASITKVMTAVVALDLAAVDEVFTVSEHASLQVPTKIVLLPGQRMTLYELLEAVLMTSANDATQVIKEGIDARYGEPVFIKAMNEKAKILGLKDTHFQNPQGFDARNHFSSAHDLAILTYYAMTKYPIIAEIVQKDYAFLSENGYHGSHDLFNWNGLLGVYPNIIGVKIGNTGKAGKTTVVLSERAGKKILVVLLGAPGIIERDVWASQLLDFGYKETLGLPPVGVTQDALLVKYATWNVGS